jgi:hypothetical protein
VPVLAPAPPRFLSQDEEAEDKEQGAVVVEMDKSDNLDKADEANASDGLDGPNKWDETGFFSAAATFADSTAVVDPPEEQAADFEPEEMEPEAAPTPPRFAELSEEPAYVPQPRDYTPAFTSAVRGPVTQDEYRAQPVAMLFPKTIEETQPDLDKPTFLRRLQL